MAGDDDNEDNDPNNEPVGDRIGHFTEEELENIMSDTNPHLMDELSFSEIQHPPHVPPSSQSIQTTQQLSQEISTSVSDFDPIYDDFLGSPFEDSLTLPWELLGIQSHDDLNNNNNNNNDDHDNNNVVQVSTRALGDPNGPNFEIGDTSTRPVPVTPVTTDGVMVCTCCNLLRTLIHANGRDMMRLDIYGGNGFFCHAILEIHNYESNERHHQTLHFKGLRPEDVKRFIEDYCSWKETSGFGLMHDSNNAAFYHHPMNNNQLLTPRIDLPMSLVMPNEALGVPNLPLYVGLREELKPKKVKLGRQTPLAAQRERTRKLTVKDMSTHFRLPMEEAARKMSLCPTVVKKVCRKGGFNRWPYRKIISIEGKIATLKKMLETAKNEEVKARIEEQIEKLQKEISDIYDKANNNSQ